MAASLSVKSVSNIIVISSYPLNIASSYPLILRHIAQYWKQTVGYNPYYRETMRIGFIGAGKMAQALARGMIASGKLQDNITSL